MRVAQINSKIGWYFGSLQRPEWLRTGFPLFYEGASFTDIHQGIIGDCWLLSSLAAIASSRGGQELIKNMFTDVIMPFNTNDRWFKVTFPGEKVAIIDERIPVFPVRKGYSRVGAWSENELWVSLIEKAAALLRVLIRIWMVVQ